MREWLKLISLLCLFGWIREIRPSEYYMTPFILENKNITQQKLTNDVFPLATYSYLVLLIGIFLLTDLLRYKPIIILSGLCGVFTYSVLLWTESVLWLQLAQVIFGLFMSTEVAYLTYLFAKVGPEKYAMVSSYTRAAALVGRFISGVAGQLFITFHLLNYRQLIYITFAGQVLSIIWALLLPSVGFSQYFHRDNTTAKKETEKDEKSQNTRMCSSAFQLILKHAKTAYKDSAVVAWSLWYSCLLCVFAQIQWYVQLLWVSIDPAAQHSYNGAAEALLTLFGAGAAMLAGKGSTGRIPAALAGPLGILQGATALLMPLPQNIFASYVGFICSCVIFHYLITMAGTQIARKLGDESCFGLIFGINTFIGVGMQSLLTYLVMNLYEVPVRSQFILYAGLYIGMGLIWTLGWCFVTLRRKFNKPPLNTNEIITQYKTKM